MRIILNGQTNFNRTPYTITFNIENKSIKTIVIFGRPNLHVSELAKKFELKHPTNIDDVVMSVKLAMIHKLEFVSGPVNAK